MSDWKVFERVGAKLGDPFIRINKTGSISINSDFYEQILDTSRNPPKYVILAYSANKNSIAFMFTNEKKSGVISLTPRNNQASFSAVSFFKSIKLNPEQLHKTQRHYVTQQEIPGLGKHWVADLK